MSYSFCEQIPQKILIKKITKKRSQITVMFYYYNFVLGFKIIVLSFSSCISLTVINVFLVYCNTGFIKFGSLHHLVFSID